MASTVSAGSLVLEINANATGFDGVIKRVQGRLAGFAERYRNISATMANTSIAVSNMIVKPLVSMVGGFAKVGYGLEKMARQAGVTVEEIGQIGYAAEQSGASVQDVGAAYSAIADKMNRARRGDASAREEIFRGLGKTYDQMAGMNPQVNVSCRAGVRIRILVKGCDNTPVIASDCSVCRYTVYEVMLGSYTPVIGHQNVAVPSAAWLSGVSTDTETNEEYNFEHIISMQSAYPFPQRDTQYRIEYEFLDTNGEVALVACATVRT